jgi:SAM-dependent methyltransferase
VRDGGESLRARASALIVEACDDGRGRPPLIVEAGCGARSHLRYPPGATVIGLDVSRVQLRRNRDVRWAIAADVASVPVASVCADTVVSWDVLEHLPHPARALTELVRIVRPGGLVVLGLPNVVSLKGIVTRLTPWWVHVWVYRRVLGDARAGTETSDQFPTTMRLELRGGGIRRLATRLGLEVLLLEVYEGPVPLHFRRRHRAGHLALSAIGALSRLVTFGRYDATASDMVVVLRVRSDA